MKILGELKMNTRLLLFVTLTSFVCMPKIVLATDPLDTPEKGFVLIRGGISPTFCQMTNTPCGWELAAGDDWLSHGKPEPMKISSGTLRQQLNQFIAAYPGYSWAVQNGVVNFVPTPDHAIQKDGAPVIDLKIAALDINDLSVIEAGYKICEAAGLKCGRAIHAGIHRHYGKVTLHLQNVTLRQAANALVKTDGMSSWMFNFNPRGNNYTLLVDSWRGGPSLFK